MRHVETAFHKAVADNPALAEFIKIDNLVDEKGVSPIITIKIQSDPVSEVGVNGCQALDLLEYVKFLFESLNEAVPCRENSLTITKIEEGIHWQNARTKNRIKRGVEGKQEK